MTKVKFTSALKRFFPSIQEMESSGFSVKEVIHHANDQYPGLAEYLLQEDGSLRKHVNIFLDNELILDREGLSDHVENKNEMLIFQALSGG